MKRFYLRLRIMLLTLALGLASVGFFNWLDNYFSEIPVDLPKAEADSPIFVFPREKHLMPRSGGGDGGGADDRTKNGNQKSKK